VEGFDLSLPAGELTLSGRAAQPGAWELRRGDEVVGLVERSRARTRVSGQGVYWSVARGRGRLGSRLVFRPPGGRTPTAEYHPRLVRGGGRLALSNQRSFKLRAPGFFGKSWRLSDEDGEDFATATISAIGEWLWQLDAKCLREPAALLVLLATSYVIVADYQAPKGDALGG
jgi:hypothetical protein